jgi:hypothetical protein
VAASSDPVSFSVELSVVGAARLDDFHISVAARATHQSCNFRLNAVNYDISRFNYLQPKREIRGWQRLHIALSLPIMLPRIPHWKCFLQSTASARRLLSTERPRTIAQFLEWNPQEDVRNVVVNGYVRSVRKSKASQFVDIGDGSTRRPLQAVVPKAQADG